MAKFVSSTENALNGKDKPGLNNYLTVHNLPIINTQSIESVSMSSNCNCIEHAVNVDNSNNNKDVNKPNDENTNSTPLTPEEVGMGIDRCARIWFPLMFLAFNAIFWTYVYFSD